MNSLSRSHWLGNSLGTMLSNVLMQFQRVLRHPRCFSCPSERKRNLSLLGSDGHLGLQLKKFIHSPVLAHGFPNGNGMPGFAKTEICQSALLQTPLQADLWCAKRGDHKIEQMNKSWLFFFWCELSACNTALLEINLSLIYPWKTVKFKKYPHCGPHLSAGKIPLQRWKQSSLPLLPVLNVL